MLPTSEKFAQMEIIIADDDHLMQLMHAKVLEKIGVANPRFLFSNGKKALEHINLKKRGTPLLVLLDIFMPVMDGWEFLKLLEEQGRHLDVQVIVISSSVGKSEQKRALGFSNVVGFHEKPLTVEDLKITLQAESLRGALNIRIPH